MTTPTAPYAAPAPPDNPNWYLHQAAGHWSPPPPYAHPTDPVFGPCTCHWTGP